VRSLDMPFAEAVRMGEALRRLALQSEDAVEGVQAYLEKREPGSRGAEPGHPPPSISQASSKMLTPFDGTIHRKEAMNLLCR